MTTHLSARLVWHDDGWNGKICQRPDLNVSCAMHEHVREWRNDKANEKKELSAGGSSLSVLNEWQPPCARDPGAFSDHGFRITHRDPLDFRGLPPAEENVPPFSFCPSPYRWMREENFRGVCESENLNIPGPEDTKRTKGWVYEPSRQRLLLERFWSKFEKNRSLVFFYCNQANPIGEEASRVIVGIGRIRNISRQVYFGTKPGHTDQYPVWSRCITHDFPKEGFRLPYQEYLRNGYDLSKIKCHVPDGSLLDFSYVGEHVSDDVAVGVLDRLVHSVEAIIADGKVSGNWMGQLQWLNNILSEVWSNRGPNPGIGSVLRFLGMSRGTLFQRTVLDPHANKGQDPWVYMEALLNGSRDLKETEYRDELASAALRWKGFSNSRRQLLEALTRFELTVEQVNRIAKQEMRATAGINVNDEELLANLYLICERDEGEKTSERISLEVIDRGMCPESDAALHLKPQDRISQDDPRRVRAVMCTVLADAAQAGDTLLPFNEALRLVRSRFPERRACNPDGELITAQADFFNEGLRLMSDNEPPLVALKHLGDLEDLVRKILSRRVTKTNPQLPGEFDWNPVLDRAVGTGKGTSLGDEAEKRARAEKIRALGILFERRFSILTGGAGTGKTSVLAAFLDGLQQLEGHNTILLLAPTGKARVRLSSKTERNASTIHQFLLKQGWLKKGIFALKQDGGQQAGASTVIIDESSMIPMDLLGTLFRALDLNKISRLILVGDPNQLPPIGPGRPFVDIIAWLEEDAERSKCIARLEERARHESHDSWALRLADGFQRDAKPGDDELLAAVAQANTQGDLEVRFWKDHSQLYEELHRTMSQHLGISGATEYAAFNHSLGIDSEDWKQAEAWQILGVIRGETHGTSELNRIIQSRYKRGLILKAQRQKPKPFGDQEIVWTDKVIQTRNDSRDAWPRDTGLDYVANGEIGIVSSTSKAYDSLDVAFSTQSDVTYRYFRSQIDDNLELAYALTVHKAQGSDFDLVFFVLPQSAVTLSRELLYTALTRFRKRLILLIQKDVAVLESMRRPESSATLLRNSHLFTLAVRPESVDRYFAAHLIHRTAKNVLVRSKSEVIVADTLTRLGISYDYEKRLEPTKNPKDFRLPDFTVSYEGDVFYWEHLGMLSVPSYRESWERKKRWYATNGFNKQLIVSEDGPDGRIDASEIERIANQRIVNA